MKKIYVIESQLKIRYQFFCEDCYHFMLRIKDKHLVDCLIDFLCDFKEYIESSIEAAKRRLTAAMKRSRSKGYFCVKARVRIILDSVEKDFRSYKSTFWTIVDATELKIGN